MSIRYLNKRSINYIMTLVVIFVTMGGCGTRPSDVPDDQEMISLLTDMYKAEAYASTDPVYAMSDSMRRVLRESVLNEHNLDEAGFNRSLDWYGHNMDKLGDIYEEVSLQLKEDATGTTSHTVSGGDVKNAPDNLWQGNSRISLSPARGRQHFRFELSNRQLKQGEQIVWEFTTPLLPGRISTFIGVDYKDGSFGYTSQTYHMPGTSQLILTLDADKEPERVFGQSTYIPVSKEIVFVDSIRLISRPNRNPMPTATSPQGLPMR